MSQILKEFAFTRFLMEAGPVIFPLMVLAVVILLLVLWNSLVLIARSSVRSNQRRHSIDGILFWGGFAAVLGFLGQWIGIGRMAQLVAECGIVSPQAVAYGISESLLTPISGMVVFLVATLFWFVLRIGLWVREGKPRVGAAGDS